MIGDMVDSMKSRIVNYLDRKIVIDLLINARLLDMNKEILTVVDTVLMKKVCLKRLYFKR